MIEVSLLTKDIIVVLMTVIIIIVLFTIYQIYKKIWLRKRTKNKSSDNVLFKLSYIFGSIVLVESIICRFYKSFLVFSLFIFFIIYILITIYNFIKVIINFLKKNSVNYKNLLISIVFTALIILLPSVIVNFQIKLLLQQNWVSFNGVVSEIEQTNASYYIVPKKYRKLLTIDSIDIFKNGKHYNILFYVNLGLIHSYDAILFTSNDKIFIPEEGLVKRRIKPNWYRVFGNFEYRLH